MRKVLLTIILLLPLCAMAQDKTPTLVVALKSGATDSYALTKKPVIKYGAETMTIAAEGIETTYEISAVEDFHFEGDLEANSIKTVEAAAFNFRQTAPNVFTVEGANGAIVCNTSGQTIKNYKAAEQITIDLTAQPAGVYIISIKSGNRNQSVKILKK